MRLKILVLTLSCFLFAVQAQADDLSRLMPESVGDMFRIQLITGNDAQVEVDKLHGKALPAKASVVARYAKPEDVASKRPAEVWVSQVASEKEARRQTGLMVHKMYENPRSPFKNPQRVDHNGIAVYRFEGMGQIHLIWFAGDLVYWISSSAEVESAMLDEFCKKIGEV
ncbi:hypothetical protein OAN24_00060 [Pseudodesulfovibrio sp.]|nr:hypothetical protein [Pseudodesulfovibrio sp.]